MIGVHDRHVELAQQRDEFRRAEAVVADLDDVAQRMPAKECTVVGLSGPGRRFRSWIQELANDSWEHDSLEIIVKRHLSRDRHLISGYPALKEVSQLLHILKLHKGKWILCAVHRIHSKTHQT